MIRFMICSDESESDKTVIPSSCLLFIATTDSMISILSYLSMANICRLDTAVTNTPLRVIWLSILRGKNHRTIDKHYHNNKSIRWFVERGIRPEYLKTSKVDWRINGGALLGMDMSILRYIDSYNSAILDEDILSIAHGCPNLAEIRLHYCLNITDASMVALGRRCRQLIFIDVEECRQITDIGLTAYANACRNVNDGFNLLGRENGSVLRRITGINISGLGRGCPTLCSMNLSGCIDVTDIGISALAGSCPLLTDINFSFCSKITDTGILAVVEGCPLLSVIYLRCCDKITDIGISALAHGCPLLTDINLRKCSSISDMAISSLAQGCPLLSKIDLSLCFNITDVGISTIGQNCKLLRSFNSSRCSITDIGISALAHGCPLLTDINVSDSSITDIGLSALLNCCPLLSCITLDNCNKIFPDLVVLGGDYPLIKISHEFHACRRDLR